MLIDRSNYELWLIDWIDGNLNNQQIEELLAFLNCNPDIQEEFEELTSVILKPLETKFLKKESLKKSFRELSESQFEYLSIAFLENDISPDQRSELEEIIEKDPEKLRIFDLIQKTKLIAPDILYSHKHQLIRQPLRQKVIRWSLIGLSAAATIAIVILSFLAIQHPLTDNDGIGKLSDLDTTFNTSAKPIFSITKTIPVFRRDGKSSVSTIKTIETIKPDSITNELVLISKFDSPGKILPPPLSEQIALALPNILISQTSPQIFTPIEDEISNVGRFIARVFREKILKENTIKTSPLEAFEIAEAGVTGLNKLFGWEMALNKNIDEDGKPGSVYFSSRLLKFNTPAKKTEIVP
jgi:hypothetical protein